MQNEREYRQHDDRLAPARGVLYGTALAVLLFWTPLALLLSRCAR